MRLQGGIVRYGRIAKAIARELNLSETTFVCPRRLKAEWPHMPAHADDVIVNFCCVHGVDITSVGLLLQLFENRRAVRAREKEFPR